jgi:NTP pyrophosphatase (non-canonical NTP hydrolase)
VGRQGSQVFQRTGDVDRAKVWGERRVCAGYPTGKKLDAPSSKARMAAEGQRRETAIINQERSMKFTEHKTVEIDSATAINAMCQAVHEANHKWWVDLNTGEPLERNVGELIALCHSELSEALEGHRRNLMDDKLPNRKMFEVELADCVIRIFDIAAGMGLDLGGAFDAKMARHDHTKEARLEANGKKY